MEGKKKISNTVFVTCKIQGRGSQLLCPLGHLAMSEVILGCDNWGQGATSISWAEARDAVKPTMYRTAPHNKESSGAKCQQYWGWHWSRVVWTFWNSRTCSWRSPDFIVGLAKMKRMPTDQNPALQLLHLSCGTLASNFSSESMRGPWMKPGSGESPGEEAPGSEQWRQSLGKASLWFRKLYRQREERLP